MTDETREMSLTESEDGVRIELDTGTIEMDLDTALELTEMLLEWIEQRTLLLESDTSPATIH